MTMSKQDLTEYSDSELSLNVMNDEGLYRSIARREQPLEHVREFLSEFFIFTADQVGELCDDLKVEWAEESDGQGREPPGGYTRRVQ